MNTYFKSLRLIWALVLLLISNQSNAFFLYDGVWYNPNSKDKTAKACYGGGTYGFYSGDKTIHAIANGYTVIGIEFETFRDCFDLTSVSVPSTITYIEGQAFRNCYNLKSINIPSGITRIESYTFASCHDLSSEISLPNVIYIGECAFSDCESVPSIKLGNNVTYIGDYAFMGCSTIEEITIPNGVTAIRNSTFKSCENLKVVNMYNSIDSIGAQSFSVCSSLETIHIPNSVKHIAPSAFSHCSSLKNVDLPIGLPYIDKDLFSYCKSLETIILPESISYIKEQAFQSCSNLKSIDIPNNVHTIYNSVFSSCSSLETVHLGKNVSSIGYNAFSYCVALKDVYSANPIPPSVKIDSQNGTTPFSGVNIANVNLYVPNGCATAYKNHSFWKKFNIIENKPEVNENIRSVYAYGLSMEGNNGLYKLMFNVTGKANANIILTDIETGENTTIEVGEVAIGNNIVELDANNFSTDKQFNWAIEIISPAIDEPSMIFDANTAGRTILTNTRGGVTFIDDTESDAFGKAVVSNGYSQGIDVYSATQQLERTISYSGDSNNAASSYRCGEHNGVVYITDWSDASSGIYTFDPTNSNSPEQWFDGTRDSEGVFTNSNGNIIGGSVSGLDFKDDGDNAKMFVFGKDYPMSNSQQLVRYDFGGAKTWANAPDAVYPNVSALLINTNVDIVTTQNGFFASQVRYTGNNIKSVPAFIYADYNDNILYNSGTTNIVNGCCGAIAVNNDSSLFAIATPDEGIVIFGLSWNDSGVPTFTKLYTLPSSISSGTNNELTQLDFDIAGNLHAYLRNEGYRVYALPNEKPTAITAAKKSLIVKGTTSGVENVLIENYDNTLPTEYYNLQGVKIEKPSKGIFIKKQGNSITTVKM